MKQTTKMCPVCGNKELVLLEKSNYKVCVDHNPYIWIEWRLDKGQKPLFEGTGGSDD